MKVFLKLQRLLLLVCNQSSQEADHSLSHFYKSLHFCFHDFSSFLQSKSTETLYLAKCTTRSENISRIPSKGHLVGGNKKEKKRFLLFNLSHLVPPFFLPVKGKLHFLNSHLLSGFSVLLQGGADSAQTYFTEDKWRSGSVWLKFDFPTVGSISYRLVLNPRTV